VYEWEIEDEGYMKELNNDILLDEKEEILLTYNGKKVLLYFIFS
jgi:hypothetical protein